MANSSEDFEKYSSVIVFLLFAVGSIVMQVLKSLKTSKRSPQPSSHKEVSREPKYEGKKVETPQVIFNEERTEPSFYEEKKLVAPSPVKRRRFTPSSLKQMVISKEILNAPYVDEIYK